MTSASNFFIRKMMMSSSARRRYNRKKRQELRNRILATLSPQDFNSIRKKVGKIRFRKYKTPKLKLKGFRKYKFSKSRLRTFRRIR